MPECEAQPDMRAHEDAKLTDEVPESVCFIIMNLKTLLMDSEMSSREAAGEVPAAYPDT